MTGIPPPKERVQPGETPSVGKHGLINAFVEWRKSPESVLGPSALKARREMGEEKLNRAFEIHQEIEAKPPHIQREFDTDQSVGGTLLAQGYSLKDAQAYEEFSKRLEVAKAENTPAEWSLPELVLGAAGKYGEALVDTGFLALGDVAGAAARGVAQAGAPVGARVHEAKWASEPWPELTVENLFASVLEKTLDIPPEQFREWKKDYEERLNKGAGKYLMGAAELAGEIQGWFSPKTLVGGAQAAGTKAMEGAMAKMARPYGQKAIDIIAKSGVATQPFVAGLLKGAGTVAKGTATRGVTHAGLQGIVEAAKGNPDAAAHALEVALWWPAMEVFMLAGHAVTQRLMRSGKLTPKQIAAYAQKVGEAPTPGEPRQAYLQRMMARFIGDGQVSIPRRTLAQAAGSLTEAGGFSALDADFRTNLAEFIANGDMEAGQKALETWLTTSLGLLFLKAGSGQGVPDYQRSLGEPGRMYKSGELVRLINLRRTLPGHEATTDGLNYMKPLDPAKGSKLVREEGGKIQEKPLFEGEWKDSDLRPRGREIPEEMDHALGRELVEGADSIRRLLGPESGDILESAGRLFMERRRTSDPAVDNGLNLFSSGLIEQAFARNPGDIEKGRAIIDIVGKVVAGQSGLEPAIMEMAALVGPQPQEAPSEAARPEAKEPVPAGERPERRPTGEAEGAALPERGGVKGDAKPAGEREAKVAGREGEPQAEAVKKKPPTEGPEAGAVGGISTEDIRRAFREVDEPTVTKVGQELKARFGESLEASKIKQWRIKRDTQRELTDEQQEAITFAKQQTGDPRIEGDTYEALKGRLSENEKHWLDVAEGFYKDYERKLVASKALDIKHVRENYVNQLWEGDPVANAKKWFSGFLGKKAAPILKRRKLPTYAEGIAKGLKPRSLKIGELMSIYAGTADRLLASELLIKDLRRKRVVAGEPVQLIMTSRKAPKEWQTATDLGLNHPALTYTIKRGREGSIYRAPYKIHPDMEKPLKVVFENMANPSKFVQAMYGLTAVAKRLEVGVGFFHGITLVESAALAGGFKGFAKSFKALANGEWVKEMVETHGEDAAKTGLQLSVPEDVMKMTADRWIEKGADLLETGIEKVVGSVLPEKVGEFTAKTTRKGLNKVANIQRKHLDRYLWHHLHTGMKIYTWHKMVEDLASGRSWEKAIKKEGDADKALEAIKRDASVFVNDAFGGQNWWRWNKAMATSGYRRYAQLLALAPDWTLTQMRMGIKGAGTMVPYVGPKVLKTVGLPTGYATGAYRAYAARAAVAGTLAMDFAQWTWLHMPWNSDLLEQLEKEGRSAHIWDNDDSIFAIRWGRDEKTGRWIYLQPFKQVREVMNWFHEPVVTSANKLSPWLSEFIKQYSGHSAGVGYPSPWEIAKERGERDPAVLAGLRAKSVLGRFVPFSLSGRYPTFPGVPGLNYFQFLPMKSGLTQYKMRDQAEDLIAEFALRQNILRWNDEPMTPGQLVDQLGDLLERGKSNNLDTKDAFRSALSNVRGVLLWDIADALNEGQERRALRAIKGYLRVHIGGLDSQARFRQEASSKIRNGVVDRFRNLMKRGEAVYTEEEVRDIVLKDVRRLIKEAKAETPKTKVMREMEKLAK